jgi:hypothetical protein
VSGLTRDAILTANDLRVQSLDCPEWGGVIYLRVLSGSERDAFEASMQADPQGRKNLVNFRARFAVLVVCDEKGTRLFADGDAAKLGAKAAPVLDRILEAGLKLNGLTEAGVEALGKPSASGPTAASGSDSPRNSG